MRAKTRFQHKVVTANGRLLPQTKKQELWAFRQCISHYAYRTKTEERPVWIAVINGTRVTKGVPLPTLQCKTGDTGHQVQDIQGQSVLFHTCHTGRFTGTACISYER